MTEETLYIADHCCHLVSCGNTPACLLVKPLGVFERKCLVEECGMIAERTSVPYVMAAFEVEDFDAFRHEDRKTLDFVTNALIPTLLRRYGNLPLVMGGYSLGGLFALWCCTQTNAFEAVAACSPSLWVEWWSGYATTNPPQAHYLYLSVGDTEEKTHKKPFSMMGDCIRAQHERNLQLVGPARCTLEWNKGGHFNEIEQRKAKGFAWCISKIINGK